jgi:hypothetical protein
VKRPSVKVTPILRDKRRRHPKRKDVECHKSLLALNRFYYAGWDQLIGEHSFTFPPNVDLTAGRISGYHATNVLQRGSYETLFHFIAAAEVSLC